MFNAVFSDIVACHKILLLQSSFCLQIQLLSIIYILTLTRMMGSKEDAPKKRISLSLRLDHAENVLIRHLVPPARPRPKNSRYFHDGGQIVVATRLRLQHTPRLSSAHFFFEATKQRHMKNRDIEKRELRKNGTT